MNIFGRRKYSQGEATFEFGTVDHPGVETLGIGLSSTEAAMTRDQWICELTKRATISIIKKCPADMELHRLLVKITNITLR